MLRVTYGSAIGSMGINKKRAAEALFLFICLPFGATPIDQPFVSCGNRNPRGHKLCLCCTRPLLKRLLYGNKRKKSRKALFSFIPTRLELLNYC